MHQSPDHIMTDISTRNAAGGGGGGGRFVRIGAAVVLVGVLWLLYGVQGNAQEVQRHGRSAIGWMVKRWSGSGGDLSHGWIIPLVAGFAIWRQREKLALAEKKPSCVGLLVIVLSLVLHWVGYRSQLTRLSLFSLVGLLWGIPYYLYGPAVARLLIFPCSYLIFCIPFSFLSSITVPLRLLAGSITTALLNGLGIAAVRSGTAIHSAAAGGFNFDVADACSGLRSLLAMTALTAVYAWVTQKTLLKKWILFVCAVPLAIVGNISRILTIALVAQVFGQQRAWDVYHKYSGFIVFSVAILLMACLGSILDTDYRERFRKWRHQHTSTSLS